MRGSDISPLELPERTVVQIAVRKRGVVSRVVPVVCPVRGHRLLTRAREVGNSFVFPIVGKPWLEMPSVMWWKSSLSRVFPDLMRRRYETVGW